MRVNVLTDGPTISANYREDKHIGRGDELGEHYISSSTARSHLMQQLIGDKDGFNQRLQDSKPLEAPKPVVITQVAPTCCLVFSNMFD